MKKIIILIVILLMTIINVNTRAYIAKKIDLNLKPQEISIVFLKLPNSKSLLINDDNSNLFILEYKNVTNLKQILKIFDSEPDIYYLKNKIDKKIDNIYIFKQKNLLKFRVNNYTLCIYNENNKYVKNCDFVYLMELNEEFLVNENTSAIFYDNKIKSNLLNQVNESWVDSYIVSNNSFTILKINEESYNIVVVPSTNN